MPNTVSVKGFEEHPAERNYVISPCHPTLTWQRCGQSQRTAVATAERQRVIFKAMEHGHRRATQEVADYRQSIRLSVPQRV